MSATRVIAISSRWDVCGIITSLLCIVHCLLLPIAAILLPAVPLQWLPDDAIHRVVGSVVLVTSVAAFVPGYRRHRQRRVLALAGAGLLLLLLASFDAAALAAYEVPLMVLGGALLIIAHGMNRTFCRQCTACAPETTCEMLPNKKKAM